MPKFPGTGLLYFTELQSKPATSTQLSRERIGRQLCPSPLFGRGGIDISVFLGYGEEIQRIPHDHDDELAFLRSANEALEAFLLGLMRTACYRPKSCFFRPCGFDLRCNFRSIL
jgi:hypothetical protein